MRCPADNIEMRVAQEEGLEINYCPQCRGVWLHQGELEKIIERAMDEMGEGPGGPGGYTGGPEGPENYRGGPGPSGYRDGRGGYDDGPPGRGGYEGRGPGGYGGPDDRYNQASDGPRGGSIFDIFKSLFDQMRSGR